MYIMFFSIGMYLKKEFEKWGRKEKKKTRGEENNSDNSDMKSYFGEGKVNMEWSKEYMKIRFTTPYLVYKIRPIWVVLDKLS